MTTSVKKTILVGMMNFTPLTAQTIINTILKKSNKEVDLFLYMFLFFMVIHRTSTTSNTVLIFERLVERRFLIILIRQCWEGGRKSPGLQKEMQSILWKWFIMQRAEVKPSKLHYSGWNVLPLGWKHCFFSLVCNVPFKSSFHVYNIAE